jgi:hypothetical protein
MANSINDRRDLLNQYVVDQYSDLKTGQITHLDLLANSIDFAVANVRFSESASYYDDYSGSYITNNVLGDLQAVFVGNGLIFQRGQGTFWIGNDVSISGRRGATGFNSALVDRTDQVQHVIGGLIGGYKYSSFIEWLAQFREESAVDERLNELSFALGNSLSDANIDDLAAALRLSIANNKCFPAHTSIQTSLTATTPIADLRVGDVVLAFDSCTDNGRGALVPRRVSKLFRNVTEVWVRLEWRDPVTGEERELVATPGHHFLDRHGNFPPIEQMIRDGWADVVLACGSGVEVAATRIAYSAVPGLAPGGELFYGCPGYDPGSSFSALSHT